MSSFNFQQQVLKAREQRRMVIDELMFTQMKENLGKNIGDYVESTRKLLKQAGSAKTRRIVTTVEKNLTKFMKGGNYLDKFRFGSQMVANLKETQQSYHPLRKQKLFNMRLLEKSLRKTFQQNEHPKQEGILYRKLITTSRKNYRKKQYENIVLSGRQGKAYSSSKQERKKTQKFFTMI